jgi:serine/threonine-protein kinase
LLGEVTANESVLSRVDLLTPREPQEFLRTSFTARNAVVAPNRRWFAFESNSSGRFEIYVRPFPDAEKGQWLVSTSGGTRPLWARSGKELFYFGPDGALMQVTVQASDSTWSAGAPARLLEPRYHTGGGASGRTYDISLDDERFLMIKAPGGDPTQPQPSIVVVQNFFDELRRLVPAP